MNYSFHNDPEISSEIVTTPEALSQVVRELADVRHYAWDTETNGIRLWRGVYVIGHAFAWRRPNKQIRSVYIPIRHRSHYALISTVEQLPVEWVNEALRPVLQSQQFKIGHNIAFDIAATYADIQITAPVHDTMIAAKLLDENHKSYKLVDVLARVGVKHEEGWKKAIDQEMLGVAKDLHLKKADLMEKHGYEYVSVPTLGKYAIQDAVYELRLGEQQARQLRTFKPIWDMEMKLLWVCSDMSRVGVPIDTQVLTNLADEQQAIMDALTPQIWALAGEEFDITADQQLRRILFQKMKYQPISFTETELPAVDDDALWGLEKQGCQLAGLVRKWNDSEKIVSTYTQGIISHADSSGVLHAELDQSGARTGRVSCKRPNLQNLPIRTELGRKVRRAFVARPGFVRYCFDYSQLELRVLAHLSQDPILLQVYRQGLDAHSMTAKEVFGTDGKVDGVDMRRIAKILNFGVSFGMTEIGLMRNVNKDLPEGQPQIGEDRAKAFLANFYRKYQGVDRYRQQVNYLGMRNSGLLWNAFGRPRRVPDLLSPNRGARSRAERQAISSMVQGSAADLVKFTMVAAWEYLKQQTHAEAYMVMMIHDDLQFDIAYEGSARVARDLHRIIEGTCQSAMSIPIKADCEWFSTNWAEKKKLKGLCA